MTNLVAGSELERVQKQLETDRKGNFSISYEMDDINFDHLRRKRAFFQGVNIELQQEFDKEQLIGFSDLPDVLPVRPKGDMANMKYDEVMRTTATEEEQKEAAASGTPGPNSNLFNYDSEDTASRNALLDRFELIKKRQIDLKAPDGKPAAVIFNPYVSGNRVEEIQGLLYGNDIENQVIMCEE